MKLRIKEIREFFQQNSGAAAIEFAILVVPFTLLIFGIIEISLMFTAQTMLQSATNKATREIRTAELHSVSDAEDEFEKIVCNNINLMLECEKLGYEVVDVDNFSDAADLEAQFDDDNEFESRGFELPGAESTVLVRTVYRYPLATNFFQNVFADGPDNETRLFISTNVLEIEPFEF